MKGSKWKEGWLILFFILGCGFILLFNLWARSLENHGYLRYAEIAREMVRSGEWVVPHLNGEVFIDKPPLLFWLIAIPSSIYGSVTPFIAKLPSAFSAWIGTIILFLWGRRVYGSLQSGLIAGGVLLSSYQYFYQSRLAKTDLLLCFFIIISLYLFYLGFTREGKKAYSLYCLSFLSMGLGVLTKGPFGLIPLGVMALFLIKERLWRIWISREFLLGYIILALTVLPWFILFVHRVGFEEWVGLMKGSQILTRKAPFYFYLIEIWGQFFPWSLLLPFLFFYMWKDKVRIWNSIESFFFIWFITIFIILTLFQYKASRYLLPTLPPLALMIGGMWHKRIGYFMVAILFFASLWHIREIYWIKNDIYYSPGMVLAGELRPLIKESNLFGYRLDTATIEEINFYIDRVIPVIREIEGLSAQSEKEEEILVLMPSEVYEGFRNRKGFLVSLVKEFKYKQYKKGRLVLISIKFSKDSKD